MWHREGRGWSRLQRRLMELFKNAPKLPLLIVGSIAVIASGGLVAVLLVGPPTPRSSKINPASNPTSLGTSTEPPADQTNDAKDKGSSSTPKPSSSMPQSSGSALPAVKTPATILNLTNWKITLPTGKPDEILQPQLNTFSVDPYFHATADRSGVVFRAPVDGAVTSGTTYPRSELREMTSDGKKNASWSNTSGYHSLTIKQAITHLPAVKPDVVAGQIHDSSDDIIEIRLLGSRLYVEGAGKDVGVLEANYQLGATFEVKVEATNSTITVSYNGAQKVSLNKSGSGWYFKAGCYTQSNPSKGDKPGEYGEVVIYALQVTHS